MRKIIPIILFAIATMVSCSTLDCPLNNTVYTKYKLDGNVTQLTGSYMTIRQTNKMEKTAFSSIRMRMLIASCCQ